MGRRQRARTRPPSPVMLLDLILPAPIEGHTLHILGNQDDVLLQRVGYPKLVRDIRVQVRQVRNHHIRPISPVDDVPQNILLFAHVVRPATSNPACPNAQPTSSSYTPPTSSSSNGINTNTVFSFLLRLFCRPRLMPSLRSR